MIAPALVFVALSGLGWGLYIFLPPEPLWRFDGCWEPDLRLADQSLFFTRTAWTPSDVGPRSSLVLRDLRTGEPIRTFFADALHSYGLLFLSPGGDWIACSDIDTGTLRLARVADGAERSVSFDPGEGFAWCDLSADGALAAIEIHSFPDGMDHYRFAVFETATGKKLAEAPFRGRAEFMPGGALMAAYLFDDEKQESFLKMWDVRKRDWVQEFELNATHLRTVDISPDGRTLLYTRQTKITNQYAWSIWNLDPVKLEVVRPKNRRVRKSVYSETGRRLAIVHDESQVGDYQVDVWDSDARRFIFHFDSVDRIREAILSPDGKRLVVQTSQGGEVKTLIAFDVDSGRRLWQNTEAEHMFWPEPSLSLSADGRSLVIYRGWREPPRADIHEVETGKLLAALPIAPDDAWSDASVKVMDGRRIHVVDVQRNPPPAWWRDWLAKFVTLNDGGFTELLVLDIEKQCVRARLERPAGEIVLDAGRRLLSVAPMSEDGRTPGQVCCWELPGHGPWRWVLGIPAALGGLICLVSLWRRASAKRRTVISSAIGSAAPPSCTS